MLINNCIAFIILLKTAHSQLFAYTCINPPEIDYNQELDSNCTNVPHGGNCTIYCKDGYFSEEPIEVICKYGKWEPWSTPSCQRKRCYENPMFDEKTQIVDDNCKGSYHGQKCRIRCKDGYFSEEPMTAFCVNGNWTTWGPPCKSKRCYGNPKFDEKTQIVDDDCKWAYHGKTCRIRCKDGYFSEEPMTAFCVNGNWITWGPLCERKDF